jgi:NAD(P)-dependent dehydrogenase (short-subunit alcohol dehydrogenase family)
VVGYSAAKAAVENFTRWLAVELAQKFGEGLRVNAIAPGFFIGEQNRRLLLAEDGSYTPRGETIIAHTPMGRFGRAEELNGTIHWLCSDASSFVTGIVVPIDGGFSAFSGV